VQGRSRYRVTSTRFIGIHLQVVLEWLSVLSLSISVYVLKIGIGARTARCQVAMVTLRTLLATSHLCTIAICGFKKFRTSGANKGCARELCTAGCLSVGFRAYHWRQYTSCYSTPAISQQGQNKLNTLQVTSGSVAATEAMQEIGQAAGEKVTFMKMLVAD
jgi:hypothetical protein